MLLPHYTENLVGISTPKKKNYPPPPAQFPADTLPAAHPPLSPGSPPPLLRVSIKKNQTPPFLALRIPPSLSPSRKSNKYPKRPPRKAGGKENNPPEQTNPAEMAARNQRFLCGLLFSRTCPEGPDRAAGSLESLDLKSLDCQHVPDVPCTQTCLPGWYQVRFSSIFGGCCPWHGPSAHPGRHFATRTLR